MKKVVIILGTRPEAIKLLPLFLYLKTNSKELGLQPLLLSTGQHKEMLSQIFSFFGVKADFDLSVMSKDQTLTSLTAKLVSELGAILEKIQPQLVIVQGDTTTAMVGSLVAFYQRIRVAHVEAGLRTYNRFSPYPEEVNRQLIGVIADYHFAPTDKAAEILKKEGKTKVYQVGNTVIDSLMLCLQKVRTSKDDYRQRFSQTLDNEYLVLVTGHRRENFGEGLGNVCDALITLADRYPNINFMYPVHLNPNVKNVVEEKLKDTINIKLFPPLPYDELIFIMSQSHIILTDSGGIQEEAPSLNVPLLVMRNTTERQEGIEAGCAKLVGTERDKIIDVFVRVHETKELYDAMSQTSNPYGDGKSSSYISHKLSNLLNNEE